MKYKDFTMTTGLKQRDFKKGIYFWRPEVKDFEAMTTIGQKPATKRDKWTIELQADDLNVVGECDYNIARIICLMQDTFFDYKREVLGRLLQLKETLGRKEWNDVIKDLNLENLG